MWKSEKKLNPFHNVSAPISFSHHAMIAINADDDYWLRENQHDSNLWLFFNIPVGNVLCSWCLLLFELHFCSSDASQLIRHKLCARSILKVACIH